MKYLVNPNSMTKAASEPTGVHTLVKTRFHELKDELENFIWST